MSRSYISYFRRYRATFLIVRMENDNRVHSEITVRRTGQIIGKHVVKLAVQEFSPDHVRSVFQPPATFVNISYDFDMRLEGVASSTLEGMLSIISFASYYVVSHARGTGSISQAVGCDTNIRYKFSSNRRIQLTSTPSNFCLCASPFRFHGNPNLLRVCRSI